MRDKTVNTDKDNGYVAKQCGEALLQTCVTILSENHYMFATCLHHTSQC